MDTLIFDGKEYTKVSALAKKFGYTTDYLGQLCRTKKVDARMVGRSWYIDVHTLETHKKSRYKTTENPITKPVSGPDQVPARIDVQAVMKGKTLKYINSGSRDQVATIPTYINDDNSLFPQMNQSFTVLKRPLTEPVASGKLLVKGFDQRSADSSLKPLLEVSSPNRLPVLDIISKKYPPAEAEQSEKLEKHSNVVTVNAKPTPQKTIIRPTEKSVSMTRKPSVQEVPTAVKPIKSTSSPFTPKKLQQIMITAPKARLLLPAMSMVVAILLASVILTAESEILASANSYQTQYSLQTANLVSIFDKTF